MVANASLSRLEWKRRPRKTVPLRQPEVYEAAPPALFWILRNESLQRGMPSLAHLPEAQRWQIVTCLQALGPR